MRVPLLLRVASGRESNLDFVVLAVAFASWDFFCVLFFVSLVLLPDLGSSDEEFGGLNWKSAVTWASISLSFSKLFIISLTSGGVVFLTFLSVFKGVVVTGLWVAGIIVVSVDSFPEVVEFSDPDEITEITLGMF